MNKKGMPLKDWIKTTLKTKVEHLKIMLEGGNGDNGVLSDTQKISDDVDGLHTKLREVEKEVKRISHSMVGIKWQMKAALFLLGTGALNEIFNFTSLIKLFLNG